MITTNAVITQLLRLHQISCGFVKTDEGNEIELSNNRMPELLSVLEETNGKAIIWANYRHDIQAIEREITKVYGSSSVASYYGDTPGEERQEIVERFQTDDTFRFFVGQPRTGGYGLTLTAASTVVYYSNSYDLEVSLQSEDRAHRIGQNSNVTYIDLIANKTVDEKIVSALRKKINIATEVLEEGWKKWLI
jgi:SNF2 family DNA or RNA helicase